MVSVIVFLCGLSIGWALCREYCGRQAATAQTGARTRESALTDRYRQQLAVTEAEARARELALIDRYLKREGVARLVEREEVVKLADPEARQPRTWTDDLVRLAEIQDSIEERHPDAGWLTVSEVKARWPLEWAEMETKWEEEHTPLRV